MKRDKLIDMLVQAGFPYTSDLLSKIDCFERLVQAAKDQGRLQERALLELARLGQEIERPL